MDQDLRWKDQNQFEGPGWGVHPPERKETLSSFWMVTDFRGPAETLDFTDLVMMSFPKAKRFTDHYSAGPGPNAYDITSLSSEKSVGWMS